MCSGRESEGLKERDGLRGGRRVEREMEEEENEEVRAKNH